MKSILAVLFLFWSAPSLAAVQQVEFAVEAGDLSLDSYTSEYRGDIKVVEVSKVYDNYDFKPWKFNFANDLPADIGIVRIDMNYQGFLKTKLGINRMSHLEFAFHVTQDHLFLFEILRLTSARIVSIETYSVYKMKVNFKQPRILSHAAHLAFGTDIAGIKKLTFANEDGSTLTVDMDPNSRLLNHLALTSRTPIVMD